MSFGAPDDLTSIATHVQDCLSGFNSVCISLVKADSRTRSKIPSGTIHDCLGRYRLWVGNIGAHRRGRGSLDYKLREASHIRDRVIELLQNLKTVLKETLEIISGERVPWEDLSDSDSEGSEDELHPSGEEPTTELAQLASNMAEINSCLMRLSLAIRNPAPHDQFKESSQVDVTHYETFDIDHVRGKFPRASEYLVQRLGKAISRRRQYLRYREEHRKKLEQGLKPQPIVSDVLNMQKTTTTVTAPSEKIQSTVASSIPLAIKARTSTVNLDEEDLYEDTLSQTSYASSNNDSSRLRPPPLPEEGQDGDPFECPLCFRFTSVRQATAWHKHVYRDLQPYVCTFDQCKIPDRTYESRHEWFQHELQAHRKWWECIDGCNKTFQSVDEFCSHLSDQHKSLSDQERLSDLLRNCERQQPMDAKTECYLCFLELPTLTQLRRHLGKHHEELSLFALPSHTKDDDEEIDDDRSADGSGSSVAGTNNSTVQSHIACDLCDLEFRGRPNERIEELDLHMNEIHGHVSNRISTLKDGDPELAKARHLLAQNLPMVQSLHSRPFNRSLIACPILQQLPADVITWAQLKHHFRDNLRAKDLVLEKIQLLQAVQCGTTLTGSEFAEHLKRLVEAHEDGLLPKVASKDKLFQIGNLRVKGFKILEALNDLGTLRVLDEDTYIWENVGYALSHQAKLSVEEAEGVRRIYKLYELPSDQRPTVSKLDSQEVLLQSSVDWIPSESSKKSPIRGRVTLMDECWHFTTNDGRMFRLLYEDIISGDLPSAKQISLIPTSTHNPGDGWADFELPSVFHFQFHDTDDFVTAFSHALLRLGRTLRYEMPPTEALILQQSLVEHGADELAHAVRGANSITNIEVNFTSHDQSRKSMHAFMLCDLSGISFCQSDGDTQVNWTLLGRNITKLSKITSRSVQVEVENLDVYSDGSRSPDAPLRMGRGYIDLKTEAGSVTNVKDLVETYITWKARGNYGNSSWPDAMSSVPDTNINRDNAHPIVRGQHQATRLGPSSLDAERSVDDESIDQSNARPEILGGTGGGRGDLSNAGKRRAQSPPNEESPGYRHLLTTSVSDESELSDGEDEKDGNMQSESRSRYHVRVLDHDPSMAALFVSANILNIETYGTPDKRKEWSTEFSDIQDCAFGTDDVITLFGLQNAWTIETEDLRIVAADVKKTEKLKALILHYMDTRRQQTDVIVDQDQVGTDFHSLSHNAPLPVANVQVDAQAQTYAWATVRQHITESRDQSFATIADDVSQSSPLSTIRDEWTDDAYGIYIGQWQGYEDVYPPSKERLYHSRHVYLTDKNDQHSAIMHMYNTYITFYMETLKSTWYLYSQNVTHIDIAGDVVLHGIVGQVSDPAHGIGASVSKKKVVVKPQAGKRDKLTRDLVEFMRRYELRVLEEHERAQQKRLSLMPEEEKDGSVTYIPQGASQQQVELVTDTPIIVAWVSGVPTLNEYDLVPIRVADEHLYIGLDTAGPSNTAMRIWRRNFQLANRMGGRIYLKGWLERVDAPLKLVDFTLTFRHEKDAKSLNVQLNDWLREDNIEPKEFDAQSGKFKTAFRVPPTLATRTPRDTPGHLDSPSVERGASIDMHKPVGLRDHEFAFEVHGALTFISGSIVYAEITADALLVREPKVGRESPFQIPISNLERLRLSGRSIYFTDRITKNDLSLIAVNKDQAKEVMSIICARKDVLHQPQLAQYPAAINEDHSESFDFAQPSASQDTTSFQNVVPVPEASLHGFDSTTPNPFAQGPPRDRGNYFGQYSPQHGERHGQHGRGERVNRSSMSGPPPEGAMMPYGQPPPWPMGYYPPYGSPYGMPPGILPDMMPSMGMYPPHAYAQQHPQQPPSPPHPPSKKHTPEPQEEEEYERPPPPQHTHSAPPQQQIMQHFIPPPPPPPVNIEKEDGMLTKLEKLLTGKAEEDEKAAEIARKAQENAKFDRLEQILITQQEVKAAKKAAEDEAAKLKPSDAPKPPIKFRDPLGRKFSFPWHICKTWKGMEELIKQAFLYVDVIGPHVHEGHYDLAGPNGEIILPQVWETMVQPGWAITMYMWPIPELLPPLPPPPPPPVQILRPSGGDGGSKNGKKKAAPTPFFRWAAGPSKTKEK